MKKIAMLLALCLVATMILGVALGEDSDLLQGIGDAEPVLEDGDDAEILLIEEDEGDSGEEVIEIAPDEIDLLSLDGADASEQVVAEQAEPALDGFEGEEQVFATNLSEATMGDEQEVSAPAEEQEEAGETESTDVELEPHVDPEGPKLTENILTLGVGETFDLKPALPAGKTGEIALASSDTGVATVSEKGVVTAVGVGDACVTATAGDGAYAECFVHVKKAPDKVAFSATSMSIGVGESASAPKVVVGSAEGEYAGACTFKSSNVSCVTVDDKGVLKGVKVGDADVTVTTYNGRTATCAVSVKNAPDGITASVDKATLGVGEQGKISYKLPDNTACQVTFASDNSAVVQVDASTGVMVGVSEGSTRVRAETFNGKKSYVDVKVVAAPKSLTFDVDEIRLGVDMSFTAKATLNKGATATIEYSIKNKTIATCSSGKLKGVKRGATLLTAKTYNGLTAECPVIVTDKPEKVTLPYKTLYVAVGQKVKLEPDVGDCASTFTYSTSDKKYVKVSSDGTVKGVKKGRATITIKTYNKKKFKLTVKVVKNAKTVTVSPTKLELGIGETAKLKCAFPKKTSAIVTFSSSDTGIATVDKHTGEVTGVAPGEATITARIPNGKKAKAKVTVYKKPDWFNVVEDHVEIGVGQGISLEYEMSSGSRSPLKYSSDDVSVASVSKDGVITGIGTGQALITVRTNVTGLEDSVMVTVLPAPESISLAASSLKLNVGETASMVPTVTPSDAEAHLTYTSSDKSVATVSKDGHIETLAKGKATLTVSTYNGLKKTLKLTVEDPWYPEKVTLVDPPSFLKAGDSVQLKWTTVPGTAIAGLEWNSSNESIAKVTADGLLTGVALGYAEITATSTRNKSIKLSFTVGVETDGVTLEIPARTTGISGISKNLKKIDAIRKSAIRQIEMLYEGGVITSADASRRETIINNAFKDYAFPWMTLKKQKYWKKANSEGGAKDFKTGKVYYGMPYISGSGSNREYNVAKALKENRYYDSGNGYYVLNQKNLKKGKYCGNDCSCFVDAAIWGTSSKHSDDRTKDIAKSSAYKTIKGYDNLRTGDLICKGGSHVVMFLYFTNADKSKIMIIENGGIEKGTNTVHCMEMKVKWYTNRSYKIRRLKTLG